MCDAFVKRVEPFFIVCVELTLDDNDSATPAVSEMIKFAWMQYLAVLVVVWVLIRLARGFLFGQKLVSSVVITDHPQKLHRF